MGSWECLLIVALMPLLLHTASAMNCYQCNSALDHNCQERFNHSVNNPQRSIPCKMYNAKYCVKVTGLWGGIVGTHRFCSSKDLGYQCQDMRFPDHSRKYRGCIYTCTGDDCNTASSLYTSTAAMVTIGSSLLSWLLR